MTTLNFREAGALGLPTFVLTGDTVEHILNYAARNQLEFVPADPVPDATHITLKKGE